MGSWVLGFSFKGSRFSGSAVQGFGFRENPGTHDPGTPEPEPLNPGTQEPLNRSAAHRATNRAAAIPVLVLECRTNMSKGDWLGEFELCVLLTVDQLGGEAYGLAVRRHLDEVTGRPVAIGAVYNTLARLKEKGLLTGHVDGPRPVQGGRSRTCFHLTPAGRRALTYSTTALGRLMARWKPSE